MPIRWKVTTLNRNSCMIYRNYFSRKYLKGSTIKAEPNTLGIFVFDTLIHAKLFVGNNKKRLILKVKPVGKEHIPYQISGNFWKYSLINFYKSMAGIKIYPPSGTICYPAVEVLE